MNETKATQLIDKFFGGATTLSEEQQLYDYFTSANVGPELMPVRQMFLDMCQLQGCEPTPKAQVATLKPRRRWRRIAAAAALVATAGIIARYGSASATPATMRLWPTACARPTARR